MVYITQNVAVLTHEILSCLSLALPAEKSLVDKHSHSCFVQSLIHYPERSGLGDCSPRNPAHIDLGTLTLLFQDGTAGLEVADLSGGAVETDLMEDPMFLVVNPDPDHIFVNTGYLLRRWTEGRWKGVPHRVSEGVLWQEYIGNQPSRTDAWERYSIAFFAAFDPNTIIKSEGKKDLHVGDYLNRKRYSMYA